MTTNEPDRAGQELRDPDLPSRARARVRLRASELGHDELADDAALVLSELVTNALLHGGGCTGLEVAATDGGLRVEVRDASRVPPVLGQPSEGSLTGRGLRLVASLATRWGAENEVAGKVVWAEVTGAAGPHVDLDQEDLLAMWDDDWDGGGMAPPRFHVELGDVPTDLLLAAKSHVDNLVREFSLASTGADAGLTAEVPPHLASLLNSVVHRFSDARVAIKRQAVEASRRGDVSTCLALDLPGGAADAGEEYIRALDEVDAYCRARRLLTLETPPQHRVFRQWYVRQLVIQLRAATEGRDQPPPRPFISRLLDELDTIAVAERASQQAARLSSVAGALATAATPEEVADAVLGDGVAALGAAGAGLLLATEAERLALPGAIGYDEAVLEKLRNESADAELPAAVALRTGEPVWLESRAERDERFPELAGLEATTVAMCAVPLEAQGRRLGALRFSFSEARLFDDDERRFVLALAAQTAQALDRAKLQREHIDISRRLQRTLLPPRIPTIPGLEIAAMYHPFGDGMDVGGDFYDVWAVSPHQWAIAIGDASGTGPEAVGVTALVRYTLRALTISDRDPAQVMATLNVALTDAAPSEENERFCTVIFGLIAVGDGIEVRLANGGHPPPMLRRADGRLETVPVRGTLLGLFADARYDSTPVHLRRGDTLALFTDGVVEAHTDGPQFGEAGVERVLSAGVDAAATTVASLERAVLRHTGGTISDDMAALVLRVPPD